jgi:4-hydroxy-tetrahydrodipicolinate synthase
MSSIFRGTGVALVTPFRGQSIDYSALKSLIDYVIAGGVNYIVSLGTTGEASSLSNHEIEKVMQQTAEHCAGRVPLVAGVFGDNNTQRLIQSLKSTNLDGFSAIMSSSPAYVKPCQEGIYQHYMAISDASQLPMIIYNVPSRTAANISADVILRLANESPRFIAVKEASGDLNQVQRILKHRPDGFLVLSGDDTITLPLIACGGDGVISVIANALPAKFSAMVRAALNGDFQKAKVLNLELYDIHSWLYKDGNPPGIKAALSMLGLCANELRLPHVPVCGSTYEVLEKELRKVM